LLPSDIWLFPLLRMLRGLLRPDWGHHLLPVRDVLLDSLPLLKFRCASDPRIYVLLDNDLCCISFTRRKRLQAFWSAKQRWYRSRRIITSDRKQDVDYGGLDHQHFNPVALVFIINATISPYSPKTSAKMRIRTIVTNTFDSYTYALTHESPTNPMA